MNPATRRTEGNASAPVLYMALELSNTSWRLAFGDGVKRRQGTPAREAYLHHAGEREGWSAVRVPSIQRLALVEQQIEDLEARRREHLSSPTRRRSSPSRSGPRPRNMRA